MLKPLVPKFRPYLSVYLKDLAEKQVPERQKSKEVKILQSVSCKRAKNNGKMLMLILKSKTCSFNVSRVSPCIHVKTDRPACQV